MNRIPDMALPTKEGFEVAREELSDENVDRLMYDLVSFSEQIRKTAARCEDRFAPRKNGDISGFFQNLYNRFSPLEEQVGRLDSVWQSYRRLDGNDSGKEFSESEKTKFKFQFVNQIFNKLSNGLIDINTELSDFKKERDSREKGGTLSLSDSDRITVFSDSSPTGILRLGCVRLPE